MQADGGLLNDGLIAVPGAGAGTASFSGEVVNNAVVNVGTGSTAVFLGYVSGGRPSAFGRANRFHGRVAHVGAKPIIASASTLCCYRRRARYD